MDETYTIEQRIEDELYFSADNRYHWGGEGYGAFIDGGKLAFELAAQHFEKEIQSLKAQLAGSLYQEYENVKKEIAELKKLIEQAQPIFVDDMTNSTISDEDNDTYTDDEGFEQAKL